MAKGAGTAWGDSEILGATRQKNEHGNISFHIVLPDGEEFSSSPFPEDQLKAGVITAWCEAVRNQITLRDEQQMEEMEARRAERKRKEAAAASADAKSNTPVEHTESVATVTEQTSSIPSATSPPVPTDPVVYAKQQQAMVIEELQSLQRNATNILSRIEELKHLKQQWEGILNGFPGH